MRRTNDARPSARIIGSARWYDEHMGYEAKLDQTGSLVNDTTAQVDPELVEDRESDEPVPDA